MGTPWISTSFSDHNKLEACQSVAVSWYVTPVFEHSPFQNPVARILNYKLNSRRNSRKVFCRWFKWSNNRCVLKTRNKFDYITWTLSWSYEGAQMLKRATRPECLKTAGCALVYERGFFCRQLFSQRSDAQLFCVTGSRDFDDHEAAFVSRYRRLNWTLPREYSLPQCCRAQTERSGGLPVRFISARLAASEPWQESTLLRRKLVRPGIARCTLRDTNKQSPFLFNNWGFFIKTIRAVEWDRLAHLPKEKKSLKWEKDSTSCSRLLSRSVEYTPRKCDPIYEEPTNGLCTTKSNMWTHF